MPYPSRRPIVLALALAATLAGCGGSGRSQTQGAPAPSTASTVKPSTLAAPKAQTAGPAHIIVVVEENHSYEQIIGNPAAPFLNQLASRGTVLSNYYAISHPSLPNYLAMTSGDTQGISSDCPRCEVAADNLGGQLERAGISWKAYQQGLPGPCSNVPNAGDYARKHDPFMYYDGVRSGSGCSSRVVPATQLDADVAGGALPRFAFVTPDLSHDMHGNGGRSDDQLVASADAWLRGFYEQLTASPAWRQDTRLVVTFDEGSGGGSSGCCGGLAQGGHVLTLVSGPHVPTGQDARAYSHYSLLRSIEAAFRLPYLRHAADPATATIPVLAS